MSRLGLSPLIRMAQVFFYRWALRDLTKKNPLHPDLPFIVHRLSELEA